MVHIMSSDIEGECGKGNEAVSQEIILVYTNGHIVVDLFGQSVA